MRTGVCSGVLAHSGTIRSYRLRVCHVPYYWRVRATNNWVLSSGKSSTTVFMLVKGMMFVGSQDTTSQTDETHMLMLLSRLSSVYSLFIEMLPNVSC